MNRAPQEINVIAGSNETLDQHLICLNQTLLESVANGDWGTYARHYSDDLRHLETHARPSVLKLN
jgi:hypothetical protein